MRWILLDDDEIVELVWRMECERAGIELLYYRTSREFLAALDKFKTDDLFFLDMSLGSEKTTGLEVATILAQKKFPNLYLVTGYEDLDVADLPHIKGVFGKAPPLGHFKRS